MAMCRLNFLWRRSTKQLQEYAEAQTFVINPSFLDYSQSRHFTARQHLCTQVLLACSLCSEKLLRVFNGSSCTWFTFGYPLDAYLAC
jgi:hypothetical protein